MIPVSENVDVRTTFAAFARDAILPLAWSIEEKGALPLHLIRALGEAGYLGALLPRRVGGTELTMSEFGHLVRELGRYSSSIRNLLTVHSMVCHIVHRWAPETQRAKWLPPLACGEAIGAFALTEPNSGSDFDRIETTLKCDDNRLLLSGTKCWISCGHIANLFLVFAKLDGAHTAILVPRDYPGVVVSPLADPLLGARASLLASVAFNEVPVDLSMIVGRPGFGKSAVGSMALDIGRFTVAWGSLGLAEASINEAMQYARATERFGKPIASHQLVARLISEAVIAIRSAESFCLKASVLRDSGDPTAVAATYLAKYSATKALATAGRNSIEILGARGCLDRSIAARAYRDAPIMELIEGTSELCEVVISDFALSGLV